MLSRLDNPKKNYSGDQSSWSRVLRRIGTRLVTGVMLVIAIAIYSNASLAAEPSAAAPDANAAEQSADARVMIISIDGLRPDCLLRANAPNIRAMTDRGSFTFWAVTTPAAVTIPSHTSMLTGCVIEKHGLTANSAKELDPQKLLVPTIFQLAKKKGISTGFAAGKVKFTKLDEEVDHAWVTEKKETTDDDVLAHALSIIRENKPRLMFVHFPDVDNVGHALGWGSAEQLLAIKNADRCVGELLATLDALKLTTTIFLTSDHGGAGISHGANSEPSKFIPWIAVGPGIVKNVDLTKYADLHIATYDTFATACGILGIDQPKNTDGKPLKEIFAKTAGSKTSAADPTAPANAPAITTATKPVTAPAASRDSQARTAAKSDGRARP